MTTTVVSKGVDAATPTSDETVTVAKSVFDEMLDELVEALD